MQYRYIQTTNQIKPGVIIRPDAQPDTLGCPAVFLRASCAFNPSERN